MVHKIIFWSGFGIAVRMWQLGIEMRPIFTKNGAWAYPFFGAIGGSFGYWLNGVGERQDAMLEERKHRLLEKRRRRAEREGISVMDPMDGGAMGRGQRGPVGNAGEDGGYILGRNKGY